jgi:hypothetical protein
MDGSRELSHHGGEPVRIARALAASFAVALVCAGAAQAATPELSTDNRLPDRREVAAGERSYIAGFEDGGFYANGWHITGEMGGVWAPPLKLVDGVWFGVGDEWVGKATKFSSGWGYTRYDLPDAGGLKLERTDLAPDADRAALFGLKLTNAAATDKTVTVKVDAHSELMGAYPWGFTGVTPNASANLDDKGSYTGKALRFTDDGALPGAPDHHYAALVAASQDPVSGEAAASGGAYRGPQPGTVCAANDSTSMPSACDDGPFGKGTGGELRYQVSVPAGADKTLWVAVAGSDNGVAAAQRELDGALADPAGALAAKVAARDKLSKWSQVSLPGDRLLQNAIDWGKQNLADTTQSASDLQIRWTNQGKQFPPPLGTVAHARWFGAGYPDYPWIFATDGEYTNFAAVALGQFEVAKDHLRALRDISDVLNNGSGIVVHEAVSDGSIWFGHDSQSIVNGVLTNDFNSDETIKFPSAVALIWRWTGDNRFRDEMYGFARRNLRAVDRQLDVDRDGWPEGSGNVERTGMGPEKLDNGVYYIRSLYDLADMARSKHDASTFAWATNLARKLQKQFDGTWWDAEAKQYADSLSGTDNARSFQKHWIGQVPMEAELTTGDEVTPGVAPQNHGTTALAGRETSCFSGDRPGSLGLFHTGCGGGADGNGDFNIFSLGTGIQAVGEGNYGRLGPDQQQRYTHANAETMFSEPATDNTPDEQPGAMPEIFPSTPKVDPPKAGVPPNIKRCWTCRSMFMQAWGNYGTAWSVVHQQLGVRPFLNRGLLEVVPQVPPDQPSVAGSNIRLGRGSVGVYAAHATAGYTTKVDATRTPVRELVIGHTLPHGSRLAGLWLDGRRVEHYDARETNRGLEVTVDAKAGAQQTLTVATK